MLVKFTEKIVNVHGTRTNTPKSSLEVLTARRNMSIIQLVISTIIRLGRTKAYFEQWIRTLHEENT